MKLTSLLITAAALSLSCFAEEADAFYRKGLAAMKQGRVETAAASFRKALALRPDHAQARYQLGQLPTMSDALKARRRESQLAGVRIPEIDFRDVSLSEALQALGTMIEKESAESLGEDKAIIPNFMVQDPTGKLGDQAVTLRLKNIPAKAALDYLLQQAGGIARFDEHATVIRPAR
jgi:tetratricopeptide (TPR) repeat protein